MKIFWKIILATILAAGWPFLEYFIFPRVNVYCFVAPCPVILKFSLFGLVTNLFGFDPLRGVSAGNIATLVLWCAAWYAVVSIFALIFRKKPAK
jgi:hypothetical protein